jgi:hypothetical protein
MFSLTYEIVKPQTQATIPVLLSRFAVLSKSSTDRVRLLTERPFWRLIPFRGLSS